MPIKQILEFWESMPKDNVKQNACPKCKVRVDKGEVRLKGVNWHRHCFRCSNCGKPLSLLTFKEVNNDILCADCYGKRFHNRWRYSEIIDKKKLSKLLAETVTDGKKYKWQTSTAPANHSDTLDSESASFYSAKSGRESADIDESSCPSDDSTAVCESVDEQPPLRTRAYTSVEETVSTQFGNASHRNAARVHQGRRFASEGIPRRLSEPIMPDSETACLPAPQPDGEQRFAASQSQHPLRHTLEGLRAPKPHEVKDVDENEDDEASRPAALISRIPHTEQVSEDSDTESDTENSQSSASQKSLSSLPPPKPRRNCDIAIAMPKIAAGAAAAVAAEGSEENEQLPKVVSTTPSEAPTSRLGNSPVVRHTRFPSDHLIPPRRQ